MPSMILPVEHGMSELQSKTLIPLLMPYLLDYRETLPLYKDLLKYLYSWSSARMLLGPDGFPDGIRC